MDVSPTGRSTGQKILVVDDEMAISDTLAIIFSTHGYASRVAYSAEMAIELLEEWQPDLAVVDVVLPGMNGIEFAIFLRASYPACRFLLFSGQPGTAALLEEAQKTATHSRFSPSPSIRPSCSTPSRTCSPTAANSSPVSETPVSGWWQSFVRHVEDSFQSRWRRSASAQLHECSRSGRAGGPVSWCGRRPPACR